MYLSVFEVSYRNFFSWILDWCVVYETFAVALHLLSGKFSMQSTLLLEGQVFWVSILKIFLRMFITTFFFNDSKSTIVSLVCFATQMVGFQRHFYRFSILSSQTSTNTCYKRTEINYFFVSQNFVFIGSHLIKYAEIPFTQCFFENL